MKILLIEDDPDLRDAMSRLLLTDANCQVIPAVPAGGLLTFEGAALNELSNHKIDLVVSDIDLSQLGTRENGVDIAKKIRAKYPGINYCLMSGRPESYELRKQEIPGVKFLPKPVSLSDIIALFPSAQP